MNELFGYAGLTLLLIAFALNFMNKLKTTSKIYNVLNIAGAILLAYYSYLLNSIPFIMLQATWGIFALFNLIRTL